MGSSCNWVGWSLPDLPARLNSHKFLLFTTLSGLAHVHSSHQDHWGWGIDGYYSVAKGFNVLQPPLCSSLPPMIWKMVWSQCMPKVNFFSCLLLNNKTLTGENLMKHGFHGPFRCCFCNSTTETTDHLLVVCDFTKKVWSLILHGVKFLFSSQNSILSFYIAWHDI